MDIKKGYKLKETIKGALEFFLWYLAYVIFLIGFLSISVTDELIFYRRCLEYEKKEEPRR